MRFREVFSRPRDVEGKVTEDGRIVLYFWFDGRERDEHVKTGWLAEKAVRKYLELSAAAPEAADKSCVLVARSAVEWPSAVAGAVIDVWKEMQQKHGKQIILVNYPQGYTDVLDTLGASSLRGFGYADSETAALERLKRAA